MRKLFVSILIGATVAATALITGTTALAVDVNINNTQITFDVEPQLINDRTMVPMRAIFETLGASVEWDGNTQTVTATRGTDEIKLTIGSPKMTVNGSVKALDSAPVMVNDRTLVPVRAVSEALGSNVEWDGATQTVNITDNSGKVDLSAATKYAPAWKTAYSKFLNGKKGKGNNFCLIYLNNDDIPELALIRDSSHMSGVALYTYADGSVKTIIDSVGSYGRIRYKERENLIASGNGGSHGICINLILSWNGSELVKEHEFMWNLGDSSSYTWNGDPISESAYNNEWNRMTSEYKTIDYLETSTPVNSANIKSALGL